MADKLFSLVPPCSYQGGKQRLCEKILDIIEEENGRDFVFYDLCCGSGSVGLEAVNRGYETIFNDAGLYGLFYEMIGRNDFSLKKFREVIDSLPEVDKIQEYLRDLSEKPVNEELMPYHYLILQAGAFGSKQIWIDNVGTGWKWCNNTFRSYWLPTEISNRKSPVNPMMPMPETLYSRVENIVLNNNGLIKGHWGNISRFKYEVRDDNRKKIVYIDPPYKNTTGYFYNFNVEDVVAFLRENCNVYVSEGYSMDNARSIVLSEGRKKGNVSGTVKKNPVIETLNVFEKIEKV